MMVGGWANENSFANDNTNNNDKFMLMQFLSGIDCSLNIFRLIPWVNLKTCSFLSPFKWLYMFVKKWKCARIKVSVV